MGSLRFRTADLLPLIEHALGAQDHDPAFEDPKPAGPALWLVHDRGVYLMSNGMPRLLDENGRSRVAYAEGCDPDKDPEWWEASEALVGGDDFAEVLGENWLRHLQAAHERGAKLVTIELTGDTLKLLLPAQAARRP